MKLTDQQVRTFRQDGVLVAEGILTDQDLAPVIAEYQAHIDRHARDLQAQGKITDLAEDADFAHRYARLYEQTVEIGYGLDIMELRSRAVFAFLRNENLLDAVECLVGPEIICSPIQHLRAKPPARSEAEKGVSFYNVPWHQDAGVTWEEADDSEIVTCWIPIVDATVENGCMELIPGAFRGGYLEHQAEGGTTIRPDLMPEMRPVPAPVRKGGAIFMHRWTPHHSTPNLSDSVRWSIDLRYQPTGTPTGRPFHPSFVVRSRQNPSSVLTDHAEWAGLWEEALVSARGVQMHRVK